MRRAQTHTIAGAAILTGLSIAGAVLLAVGAASIYLSALIPVSATGALLMFAGLFRGHITQLRDQLVLIVDRLVQRLDGHDEEIAALKEKARSLRELMEEIRAQMDERANLLRDIAYRMGKRDGEVDELRSTVNQLNETVAALTGRNVIMFEDAQAVQLIRQRLNGDE